MGVGNDIIYEDAYGEKYIGKIVGIDTTDLETAYIMSDNERVALSSVLYYCTSRSTAFYSLTEFTTSISGIVGLIVLPILLITFFVILGIAYKRNELIDEYAINESEDSSALSKPKKSASRPITVVNETPTEESLAEEEEEVKTYRPKANSDEFSNDIFGDDTKSKILEAMNKVKESNLNEDYIVFQTKSLPVAEENDAVAVIDTEPEKKGSPKTSIEQVLFEKPKTVSSEALFDISKKAAAKKPAADPLSTAQIVLENTSKPVPDTFGKDKPRRTKPAVTKTAETKPTETKPERSSHVLSPTQKQAEIQAELQAKKDRITEISTDELFDDIMKLLD
jgi:hypothetical protein